MSWKQRRAGLLGLALALGALCTACRPTPPAPMEVRPSPAAPAPVDAPPVPAPAAPDVTPAPAAQAQADAAPRPFETPRVLFHVPGGDLPVIVEVADTPDTLERGLMFRESLPDGTGMIFVFPNRRDRSFWMKNTLIPLDMIYLDGDAGASEATVVGVVADAEPQTLTSRRCGRLSRWVVEVPGGYAAQHGIAPGVRATFVDMP